MAEQKPSPCWSNIVKRTPPPQNPNNHHRDQSQAMATALVGSCKSTKGIAIAVVDANAIIQGGEQLHNFADKFVSVSKVIQEVRDPTSRHRLNFLPFTVETMKPSLNHFRKVSAFVLEILLDASFASDSLFDVHDQIAITCACFVKNEMMGLGSFESSSPASSSLSPTSNLSPWALPFTLGRSNHNKFNLGSNPDSHFNFNSPDFQSLTNSQGL